MIRQNVKLNDMDPAGPRGKNVFFANGGEGREAKETLIKIH